MPEMSKVIPDPPDQATLYELLISELTDFAVFLTSPSAVITSWNPGVERLLQYSEDEWIGRELAMIFTEGDRAEKKPELEMARALAEGRSPDVRWHQKKDGSRLYVDGTLIALKDGNGKVLGFAKVMRDITLRKNAETERERLLAELERSNDELSLFAHVAAHDLRSPLRTISSHTQILLRTLGGQLDQSSRALMDRIVQGVMHMGHLIDGLLYFAEMEHGQLEFCELAMEVIVRDALINLDSLIQETSADVTYEDLPVVRGDALQLLQLIQNLLGNALKYRRVGVPPKIRISGKREGAMWTFAVADNGEGIAASYLDHIFEPFKRLHSSDVPGTGLGLALCKKIVTRHGGKIWVESDAGSGSTFFFTLDSGLGELRGS
jgi:PAS domain S-box-containing protein